MLNFVSLKNTVHEESIDISYHQLVHTPNLAGQATYNFKHISSQNGLSNDFVLDMAIDQQGCVWVATEAGLNKWVGNGSNIVYKEVIPDW